MQSSEQSTCEKSAFENTAAWRALTEGAGEVGTAANVLSDFVEPVRRTIFSPDGCEALYDMACGKRGGVRFEVNVFPDQPPVALSIVRENPDTDNCPQYDKRNRRVVIPLFPFLEPSPFDEAGTTHILGGKFRGSLPAFQRALVRAWSFRGTNGHMRICLRDAILHEGMHMYDVLAHGDAFNIPKDKAMPSREDADEDAALKQAEDAYKAATSAGSTATAKERAALQARYNRLYDSKTGRDMAFRPSYKCDRFGSHDRKIINDYRRSFPDDMMRKYYYAAGKNELYLTPEESELRGLLRKPMNRYKHMVNRQSNPETRAYLCEQLPELVMCRPEAGYDVQKTVHRIVDRVFGVPPEELSPRSAEPYPGSADNVADVNHRETWRERVLGNIMPDAKASVERRARKLVTAINRADFPPKAGLVERMRILRDLMLQDSHPEETKNG